MTTIPDMFRVWPDQVLPARPVRRHKVEIVEGEVADLLIPPGQPDLPAVMLPEALFTRQLLALDARDAQPVAEFLNTWGVTSARLIDRSEEVWAVLEGALARIREAGDEDPRGAADLQAVVDAQRSSNYIFAEVRRDLERLQYAVRVWQVTTGSRELAELQSFWRECVQPGSGLTEPLRLDTAVADMLEVLDRGLRPFSASVWRSDWRLEDEPVGLYEAVCLQIFNAIAEGNSAVRCRNETCPYGGWAYKRGWSTDSVRYCCPECADMQTSRERRRRIRDANKLAKDGLMPEQIAARMSTSEVVVTAEQVRGWLAAAAKRRKGADT
jgi:hypothetical protein